MTTWCPGCPTQFRRPGGLDEAYETANTLGLDLCRHGQFNLDPIQAGLAVRLSEIGDNLNLVGVTLDYLGGMSRGPQKAAENLERFAGEFVHWWITCHCHGDVLR